METMSASYFCGFAHPANLSFEGARRKAMIRSHCKKGSGPGGTDGAKRRGLIPRYRRIRRARAADNRRLCLSSRFSSPSFPRIAGTFHYQLITPVAPVLCGIRDGFQCTGRDYDNGRETERGKCVFWGLNWPAAGQMLAAGCAAVTTIAALSYTMSFLNKRSSSTINIPQRAQHEGRTFVG